MLQIEQAKRAFRPTSQTVALPALTATPVPVLLADFAQWRDGTAEPQLRVSILGGEPVFLAWDPEYGVDPLVTEAAGYMLRGNFDHVVTLGPKTTRLSIMKQGPGSQPVYLTLGIGR